MPDVLIENPVINSPYEEPKRHFVFDENGITDQIADERRSSSHFIPIPPLEEKRSVDSFLGLERRADPREHLHQQRWTARDGAGG